MSKLFIATFLFFLTFSIDAQPHRHLVLLDLRDSLHAGFFEPQKELSLLLYEAAHRGHLPIYKIDYEANEVKSTALDKSYMQRFQELGREQLTHIGIDYVFEDSSEDKHIQYLHLYMNGNYFSDSVAKPIVSFQYAACAKFFAEDKRAVWHNLSSFPAILSFGDILHLDDEAQSSTAIFLAKAVLSDSISAYDKHGNVLKREDFMRIWNPVAAAPVGELQVRLVELARTNGTFMPLYLQVFRYDITTDKSYFLLQFSFEDYKKIAAHRIWVEGVASKMLSFTEAIENLDLNSYMLLWKSELSKHTAYMRHKAAPQAANLRYSKKTHQEINLNDETHAFMMRPRRELPRLLIRALQRGKIHAYENVLDEKTGAITTQKIPFSRVAESLLKPDILTPEEVILGSDFVYDEEISQQKARMLYAYQQEQARAIQKNLRKVQRDKSDYHIDLSQISLIEIEGDITFDSQGKHKMYRNRYIHLYIPAHLHSSGINYLVAKLRYEDCISVLAKGCKTRFRSPKGKRMRYADALRKHFYSANTWFMRKQIERE
ncbi:MAG: hypothetical protein JJT94_00690 [Bernardetiaceae bacterium]|nr:hypothetical protein [Bernardetiaceae bacterium]